MNDDLKGGLESVLVSLRTFDNWNVSQSWNSQPANALSECARYLDSVEATLLQTMRGVYSAKNALAPVNRLPLDVLQSIFYWLSPPSIPNFLPEGLADSTSLMPGVRTDFPSRQFHLQQWLRILAVCRHWRAVATSSPTLWSTVVIGPTFTPIDIVASQLRYSGNVPLDLHVAAPRRDIHEPEIPDVPQFPWDMLDFRSLCPRLRSFHLHSLPPDPGVNRILEQLSDPAPLLEHLTLSPIRVHFSHSQTHQLPHVLPKLFQDQTPRLKSLTVVGFLSWPENTFRNLTHLCLSEQRAFEVFRAPSLELHTRSRSQLFDLLNNNQGLEVLVLSDTFSIIEDGSHHTLYLPRLHTLVLNHWDSDSSVIFLSAFEFPPTCNVSMRPYDTGNNYLGQICASPAFHKISAFLRSMTRLYFRSRHLHFCTYPALIACGDGGLFLETPMVHMRTIQVPISVEFAQFYAAMSIEELWIDMQVVDTPPVATWDEMYAALPGVKMLVLNARHTHGGPSLLPLEQLGRRENAQPCLPNLEELHLVFDGNVTEVTLSILQRVQTERAAAGVPIPRIVVGAYPPLELHEGIVIRIRELLGPDVVCGVQDMSFNWSPFRERISDFPEPYWPGELSGRSPGLWATVS